MGNTKLHPEAALRFDELGGRVLTKLKPAGSTRRHTFAPDLYPAANLTPADIIGKPRITSKIVNGEGEEVGRETSDGKFAIGEEDYAELKKLASSILRARDVGEVASLEYVIDRIWEWIELSASRGVTESLSVHLERKLQSDVKTIEYWLPLHRTHCESDLQIGAVRFATLTRTLMQQWEDRVLKSAGEAQETTIKEHFARTRSRMQGSLAAVVQRTGVREKSRSEAVDFADRAISMLRFLSPANWTTKLRSYCTLLGHEAIAVTHTLEADDRVLSGYQQSADANNTAWTISKDMLSGGELDLITPLHTLETGKSEFQRQLQDALLIYSRNSVAEHPADKLLFVMVALESMLLRNENEPIQKNIGERLALIVGQSTDERIAIVENTSRVYGLRSRFVHHGRSEIDADLVSNFMITAWSCFCQLLTGQKMYSSKEQMIVALEKKKMSG